MWSSFDSKFGQTSFKYTILWFSVHAFENDSLSVLEVHHQLVPRLITGQKMQRLRPTVHVCSKSTLKALYILKMYVQIYTMHFL